LLRFGALHVFSQIARDPGFLCMLIVRKFIGAKEIADWTNDMIGWIPDWTKAKNLFLRTEGNNLVEKVLLLDTKVLL